MFQAREGWGVGRRGGVGEQLGVEGKGKNWSVHTLGLRSKSFSYISIAFFMNKAHVSQYLPNGYVVFPYISSFILCFMFVNNNYQLLTGNGKF